MYLYIFFMHAFNKYVHKYINFCRCTSIFVLPLPKRLPTTCNPIHVYIYVYASAHYNQSVRDTKEREGGSESKGVERESEREVEKQREKERERERERGKKRILFF